MKDAGKLSKSSSFGADLKGLFVVARTRRTKLYAYGFAFGFVACTLFLAFNPFSNGSPLFDNLFSSSTAPYRSQISSLFSYIFPNSSSSSTGKSLPLLGYAAEEVSAGGNRTGYSVETHNDGTLGSKNHTEPDIGLQRSGVSDKKGTENRVSAKNPVEGGVATKKGGDLAAKNQTGNAIPEKNRAKEEVGSEKDGVLPEKNRTASGVGLQGSGVLSKNHTGKGVASNGNRISGNDQKESRVSPPEKKQSANGATSSSKSSEARAKASNSTASLGEQNDSTASTPSSGGLKGADWITALKSCDIFQGNWVKDDSYPLYPEGSCSHIDESFNCYLNGRPDRAYQKLRWKPDGCDIPRLNATDMLERLRGKRLVFVGDSLNRNMWESLVCALTYSLKHKKKVFEASGRHEFRTEGSYSFIFRDYNCSVEFFRSPFLVQEWEMPVSNGTTKETLRLDIIERSSPKYKDADIIVFNTGHWWTHEKTSKGKDYYQEGGHVYNELNVAEAFHKALNTWAKWVDTNVNPKKTLVFFRGYSASHFSGGQWNSGGQCDNEIEPIKNKKYLSAYPPKMLILEQIIKGMKTPVSYINITRMTDYRKDAHPSIFRKQNLTEDERMSPERYQDCSHWCLPGVPDSWNELLYAQLLMKQHQL